MTFDPTNKDSDKKYPELNISNIELLERTKDSDHWKIVSIHKRNAETKIISAADRLYMINFLSEKIGCYYA